MKPFSVTKKVRIESNGNGSNERNKEINVGDRKTMEKMAAEWKQNGGWTV